MNAPMQSNSSGGKKRTMSLAHGPALNQINSFRNQGCAQSDVEHQIDLNFIDEDLADSAKEQDRLLEEVQEQIQDSLLDLQK